MSDLKEDVNFIENILNRKPDWKFWITNNLIFLIILLLGIQFGGFFTVVLTAINVLNFLVVIPAVGITTWAMYKRDAHLIGTIVEANKNIPGYIDRFYDITILVIFFLYSWNYNFVFYIAHMILLEIWRFNYSNIKDYTKLLLETAKHVQREEAK